MLATGARLLAKLGVSIAGAPPVSTSSDADTSSTDASSDNPEPVDDSGNSGDDGNSDDELNSDGSEAESTGTDSDDSNS